MECPDNKYSHPSSLSVNDCTEKVACNEDDYNYSHSKCKDGKRQIKYYWNSPLLCKKEGVAIAQNMKNSTVECEKCLVGREKLTGVGGESSCEYCKEGL